MLAEEMYGWPQAVGLCAFAFMVVGVSWAAAWFWKDRH